MKRDVFLFKCGFCLLFGVHLDKCLLHCVAQHWLSQQMETDTFMPSTVQVSIDRLCEINVPSCFAGGAKVNC